MVQRRLYLDCLVCFSLANAWNPTVKLRIEPKHPTSLDVCRRSALWQGMIAWTTACSTGAPTTATASTATGSIPHPFAYSPQWTGTCLPLLSLADAVPRVSDDVSTRQPPPTSLSPVPPPRWPMAQWPDPILRISANSVDDSFFGTETLHRACLYLQATADAEGAVGLAAQQCGVNARIIYLNLDPTGTNGDGDRRHYRSPVRLPHLPQQQQPQQQHHLTLINPRITARSSETEMQVWSESCLVLPPTFRATVLRDAWIEIAYRDSSDDFQWQTIRLSGEAARAAQHELDHDRGILVTDHVALDELENDTMRFIERPGHESRMARAYERYIQCL